MVSASNHDRRYVRTEPFALSLSKGDEGPFQ